MFFGMEEINKNITIYKITDFYGYLKPVGLKKCKVKNSKNG